MCLLFESIRVTDRKFRHLDYHQARVDRSRNNLLHLSSRLDLTTISIPHYVTGQNYKCRVEYGEKIGKVEFIPYEIKPVQSLKLVEADDLKYAYKFCDRSPFDRILNLAGKHGEIVIVKDGFITDSSYSNLAFLSGSTWYTPNTFILNGTCRKRLLDEGILQEAEIRPTDLDKFTRVSLINAMLGLGDVILSAADIY